METGVAGIELRDCLLDPLMDVMNFLNEVVLDYPDAISFAPGRPPADLFDVENSLRAIKSFVRFAANNGGCEELRVWQDLGQYNRTNGIIRDLISDQLAKDEGIHVSAESIIVTVGAQEAMAIALSGLFDPASDVLLVSDPTYIGITGLARILGIRVIPVPADDEGVDPEEVERAIERCRALGRPRAFYDIPSFNNPLGTSLAPERRRRLLEVCKKHGVLIIEDNPYGMFAYEGTHAPPIKALDTGAEKMVLYIGSFAKTLFPGLRLGYLVADQREARTGNILAMELSKVKSLLTVNSSPLLQGVVAGILLDQGGSLQSAVSPKKERLRRNRDVMLECLSSQFENTPGVRWNRPKGGYFLVVTLPFSFGKEELKRCVSQYGVIVTPMRFFTIGAGHECQIRLSFSCLDEETIREGIRRFGKFVNDRCEVR
ncbi:MAG TPA: PLP-dependent aminotransferase family protein [Blastocatellia bacterium]|nr:PLP-dependent aminotransferase family protein [Blastocatellia bacterium]